MDTLLAIDAPTPVYIPESVHRLSLDTGCSIEQIFDYLQAMQKPVDKRTRLEMELVYEIENAIARSGSFFFAPEESGAISLCTKYGVWTFGKGMGPRQLSVPELMATFEYLDEVYPHQKLLEFSLYEAFCKSARAGWCDKFVLWLSRMADFYSHLFRTN